MKIVSYSQVVPPKNKNLEKEEVLKKFISGVIKKGDTGIYHQDCSVLDCDVAVIQGWHHHIGKISTHLKFRKQIIDNQLQKKKYTCVVDSNLFLYATTENKPHHYLRYSFNGVFPNTGIYFDDDPDPKRWEQISKDLKIQVEEEKKQGKNILLCLQRRGGWSMGNVDVLNWINRVVCLIKKNSDRTIVIRPHPKDNNSKHYLKDVKLNNVKISYNKTLEEDLEKAWCVVNHNSSSIVGPIIKGYPAFITDPARSQCSEVANTDFSKIENPDTFDRQKWLERVSMFHWKFSELEDGSAWNHMRNYCQ